jgi:hypothetical protein
MGVHVQSPTIWSQLNSPSTLTKSNPRLTKFFHGGAKLEAKERFAKLLQDHCSSGTGRRTSGRGRGSWKDLELAEELQKVCRRGSDESVRKWRRGDVVPTLDFKNGLVRVLFRSCSNSVLGEEDSLARDDFEDAWIKANDARKLEIPKSSDLDSPHPNFKWKVFPGQKTNSIVELNVHSPTSTNEPGTYMLHLSLVISPITTEQAGYPITIGLRGLFLYVTSDGFQITSRV